MNTTPGTILHFIGSKKTCLGVLDRGECEKANEIGLKEGGVIEIETTVLHSRAAPSLFHLFFQFY